MMKKYFIKDYLKNIKNNGLLKEFYLGEAEEKTVDCLTYDSNEVCENTMFICKGANFKEEYLVSAIDKGSIVYISEKKYNIKENFPYIIVSDIRKTMAILADMFYNSAWKELDIIAFGGTKGKSTSAYFIKSVIDDYEKEHSGNESAIISSIDTYDGVIKEESHLTTPEAVKLHSHFRNAVESGIKYLEMEISSQALKYERVYGIRAKVGVFLNIAEDHISDIEHKNFEDYFNSKMKMFEIVDTAIINKDSEYSSDIIKFANEKTKVITFSLKDENADYFCKDIKKSDGQLQFDVVSKNECRKFAISMQGVFNIENAVSVVASADVLGIPYKNIYNGLVNAKAKGRMMIYENKEKEIVAVVDYAHNKLSFEKLYESMKNEYPDYKIYGIFGCPGLKALGRRKELPEIANKYADKIYITEEDPGKEDVNKICKEIAENISCSYEIIVNRGAAIRKAIENANRKSILLITGKGDETDQKYAGGYVKCPSDVEYVKKFLEVE